MFFLKGNVILRLNKLVFVLKFLLRIEILEFLIVCFFNYS